MEKTIIFTKIILSAIGIFFLIKLLSVCFYLPFFMLPQKISPWGLFMILCSLIVYTLAIIIMVYYLFVNREWSARKIIDDYQIPETSQSLSWLPVAIRLICIVAGLYCIHSALMYLPTLLSILEIIKNSGKSGDYTKYIFSMVFQMALYLCAGVYLVYGAPHFVRWQVRKTLEQCKKLQDSDSASD